MQYRHEIEHAPANFSPAEEKELYSLRGNAQMQYRVPALMQYGSVIGARSRYARPCVGRDCIH